MSGTRRGFGSSSNHNPGGRKRSADGLRLCFGRGRLHGGVRGDEHHQLCAWAHRHGGDVRKLCAQPLSGTRSLRCGALSVSDLSHCRGCALSHCDCPCGHSQPRHADAGDARLVDRDRELRQPYFRRRSAQRPLVTWRRLVTSRVAGAAVVPLNHRNRQLAGDPRALGISEVYAVWHGNPRRCEQ